MSITLLWLIGAPVLAVFVIWSMLRDWHWKRGDYAQALMWRQQDLDLWRVQQEERLSHAWLKVRERTNDLEHLRIELARRESAVRDAESDFNIRRLDVTPPPMIPPPYMRHLTQPPSGALPPLGPNAGPQTPNGMGETDSELNEVFGYLAPPQPPRYGRVTQPIRPFETQESRELFANDIAAYLRTQRTDGTEGEPA